MIVNTCSQTRLMTSALVTYLFSFSKAVAPGTDRALHPARLWKASWKRAPGAYFWERLLWIWCVKTASPTFKEAEWLAVHPFLPFRETVKAIYRERRNEFQTELSLLCKMLADCWPTGVRGICWHYFQSLCISRENVPNQNHLYYWSK